MPLSMPLSIMLSADRPGSKDLRDVEKPSPDGNRGANPSIPGSNPSRNRGCPGSNPGGTAWGRMDLRFKEHRTCWGRIWKRTDSKRCSGVDVAGNAGRGGCALWMLSDLSNRTDACSGQIEGDDDRQYRLQFTSTT
eukprot:scaffold310_cov335-Pavlova_lutheri.AAC.43